MDSMFTTDKTRHVTVSLSLFDLWKHISWKFLFHGYSEPSRTYFMILKFNINDKPANGK
jgi:hypothetical protein